MMAIVPMSPTAQTDAAQTLYERYYPNVYRYALSQLRTAEDAEDAVQNTFLRAFAALQKGTVPENELAWLFKIAHNVCATSKLAWLRRRRVETPRDLTTLRVEPSAPTTQRDELAGLGHALAAMPPRQREALLLREWQGLSYAEIAERLDISRSAVETLIFRARKMLAEKLEQPMRRVREALGLGPLLNLLRAILQATPTAVKATGAIAVAAGATVAAAPLHTSRPAPATPARVSVTPATVSRPGPQRAARRRTATVKAPHSVAVPQPRVPLAPGAQQSVPATPAPADASSTFGPGRATEAATIQPPPIPTPPSAAPILAMPTPPADTPSLPITLPSPPVVQLPEGPVGLPATLPSLPAVPPVTVPVSLP